MKPNNGWIANLINSEDLNRWKIRVCIYYLKEVDRRTLDAGEDDEVGNPSLPLAEIAAGEVDGGGGTGGDFSSFFFALIEEVRRTGHSGEEKLEKRNRSKVGIETVGSGAKTQLFSFSHVFY